MSSQTFGSDRFDVRGWVKATTFGWWLGFAMVVLLAVTLESVFAVEGAQSMIGVGMGAGVGFMQGRFLDRSLGSRHRWLLASTVGMGTPFVVGDIAGAIGVGIPYSLALYAAIGGLLAGLLQWRLLHHRVDRPALWVPVSVVGWMLPVTLLALNDNQILTGAAGVIAMLTGMFLGGIILGYVTGTFLSQAGLQPGR